MKRNSLTAIILTHNEEIHLERCLVSVRNVCDEIIVIDSYSTDSTEDIARRNEVTFLQNKWTNYATQFNWGIDNADIRTEWVLRIDADEYLTDELQVELSNKLDQIEQPVNGIVLPLKRVFLGRHIRRGTGQVKLLRIFRNGFGRSENRWMDEHIKLTEGQTIQFENSFADHNLNSINWWTQKHIGYAVREAVDLLDIELGLFPTTEHDAAIADQARKKRQLKLKYARKPLFLRSFVYFIYRYVLRFGFLEGKEGFLWHFLQGWWYRNLVDSNIYEIKKACGNDPEKIKQFIREKHGLQI